MRGTLNHIPTVPHRLIGLGHTLSLLRDPVGFLQSLQGLGDLAVIQIGPMRFCVANSPKSIHSMLVEQAGKFGKGRIFDNARIVLGDSLFTAAPKAHRDQRRIVQPAFHQDQVAGWADTFHDHIVPRVASWESGESLDVVKEMHSLVIESVVPTLFSAGVRPQITARLQHCVPVIVQGVVTQVLLPDALRKLPLPNNRNFAKAARELREALEEITELQQRAEGGTAGPIDLVTTLLSAEGRDGAPALTKAQVRDQAASILLAASETAATALSWLFHELARHPGVQTRLQEEVEEVLGGRPCRQADIAKLRYLQQVLTETLRLHTPNWILSRRTTEPVEFGDVVVPEGTEMIYSPAALHRDPDIYPNPEAFDPDRWEEGRPTTPRTHFIPFGTGPNKCIGDSFAWCEMTVAVATVTAAWRLAHAPGTRVRPSRRLATVQPSGLRMVPNPRKRSPSWRQ